MAITCYINSIEYKLNENFTINEQTSNRTSTTIKVLVEDQEIPKARDTVEIYNDTTRIYLGQCGIPKSPKYDSIYTPKIYTIVCGNANSILANRIVNKAYNDTSISDIVTDLYNSYITEEGFTLGEITDIDIVYEVYTANDLNLQGVLDELAEYANASWGIDENDNFYFVAESEFPLFEEDFTIDFLPVQKGLQNETKSLDQRTVQIIKGAKERTSEQTKNFTYVTDQDIFTVDYGVVEEPEISVNSVSVPSANIGIKGIDSNDPTIYFLWSFQSQLIDYNTNSAYLSNGDSVDITYIGEYLIRIQVNNQNKIDELATLTGTSGKIDHVVFDGTIQSSNDAFILADSLLINYEDERSEISFTLNETILSDYGYSLDDFKILTAVNFNLPEFNIVGKFVIVERNINIQNEYNINCKIKAVDRNFVRSYGEILKDYNKNKSLSVREDEIVINKLEHTDIMQLQGGIGMEQDISYFPTEISTSTNNGFVFYPDLGNDVYPQLVV